MAGGCANGYKEYYRPAQGATPEKIAQVRSGPPPATPVVERAPGGDSKVILDSYGKRGYAMIGSAIFKSEQSQPEEVAIKQAKEVQADLVLILNPRFAGTVTRNIPITVPTTSTTYSSGTATAYGPGGTVNAFGSGVSTTYGSATSVIPVTLNVSDYGAVFFIKRRVVFGAETRPLSDQERQDLQTNKGAMIVFIIDGSPAFEADILAGDIVITVDGNPVAGSDALSKMIVEKSGKLVSFGILRRGKNLDKSVRLL